MNKMPPPSTVAGPPAQYTRRGTHSKKKTQKRPPHTKPSAATVADERTQEESKRHTTQYVMWGLVAAVVVLGILVGVMVVMWINTFRKVKGLETERAAVLTEGDVKTVVGTSINQYNSNLMRMLRGEHPPTPNTQVVDPSREPVRPPPQTRVHTVEEVDESEEDDDQRPQVSSFPAVAPTDGSPPEVNFTEF